MARRRTKSLVATLAVLMMIASGLFSGAALAETADTGAGDESRSLEQAGSLSSDYLCVSRYTGEFRLSFTASCPSGYMLIQLSQSFPFDYCYSIYTRLMSDDRAGNTCPPGTRYVVVDGLSSFAVCLNRYTGQIYHTTVAAGCTGGLVPVFFVDLRADLTKYACAEENLNTEECDYFPAGPHNEIRQIGPIPNTSGGFQDCQWQWVFDGNNSPTQSCINDSSNADIEAALEALPGINDVSVTGGPIAGTVDAPIRIEFVGVDAQTDIVPAISIVNVASTVNQTDVTVVDGAANGPEVSYAAPGGTVQIFQATGATDPNNPATYGPEVTAGPQPVDATGAYTRTNLEGSYVVCASATDAVAPSCELVTISGANVTLVNNVDLPGTITAEITDTVGGNEIRSYDDFPFGGGQVTGGTYTITFDGQTTAALAYDATAAAVQAALEALSNIEPGDVSVSGGPPPVFGPAIVIEFTGNYAGMNVPNITIDSSNLTGGSFAGYFLDPNLTDRDGFGTTQTLTADARVSGGTFTLSYNGEATVSLDFDATVTEIEAALNALTTISTGGGSVEVSSTDPNVVPGNESITKAPVLVNFINVAGSDTTVLVVDNTNLE